jgi:hypothetical protein
MEGDIVEYVSDGAGSDAQVHTVRAVCVPMCLYCRFSALYVSLLPLPRAL